MAQKVEIDVIANDMASGTIQSIIGVLSGNLVGAATMATAALTAAIGGAVALTLDLAKAGGEAETAFVKFDTLVKNSSLAPFQEEMERMAEGLSKVTRFEDEAILSAAGMIASFDTVSQETFPDVLNASLDLAEFMGTDVTNAAETLGRAFADISGGSLTLLGRSRLLTKEQIKQAEEMAKAGDVAGAQAYIIESLDGKIGNLAENMGKTYQGQLDIFKNTLGNIKEEMGMKLLPILTPLVKKFGEFAIDIMPKLIDAFETKFLPIVEDVADVFTKLFDIFKEEGFEGLFKELTTRFGDLWSAINESIQNIDWQKVDADLAAAISSVDWTQFGITLGIGIRDALKTAMDFAKDFDMSETANAIGDAFTTVVVTAIDDQQTWDGVKEIWANNWDQFQQIVTNKAFQTGMVLQAAMQVAGSTAIGSFAIGVMNQIPNLMVLFGNLKTEIENQATQIKRAFHQNIDQLISGTINRLAAAVAPIVEAVSTLISAIRAAIKPISISISLPNPERLLEQVEEILAILGMLDGKSGKTRTGRGGAVKPGSGTGTVPMMAEGGIVSGPRSGFPAILHGTEAVIPLSNGSVPVALSGSGGGGMTINLTYAPMFSTANRSEFLQNITPMLDDWYRRRLSS